MFDFRIALNRPWALTNGSTLSENGVFLSILALMLFSELCAAIVGIAGSEKWNKDYEGVRFADCYGTEVPDYGWLRRTKFSRFCAVLLPVYTLGSLLVFGAGMITLRNILYASILVYMSYGDIKERVSDFSSYFMLAMTSCIGTTWGTEFFERLGATAAVTAIVLMMALVTKGGFNGGDVKTILACGFIFRFYPLVFATMLSLLLAIAVNKLRGLKKGDGFAMIPYITVAFLALALLPWA